MHSQSVSSTSKGLLPTPSSASYISPSKIQKRVGLSGSQSKDRRGQEQRNIYFKRFDSPEDHIRYLCTNDNSGWRQDMNKPDFIAHCIDLYRKQKGLCALTGQQMEWQKGSKQPLLICIHRIDTKKKFEIGNVILVCAWVAYSARGHMDKFLKFMKSVINENTEKINTLVQI
jgi:hypothetical protein